MSFVSIRAVGRLTHDDYQVISPMIDAALIKVNQPKVKVLFDARTQRVGVKSCLG